MRRGVYVVKRKSARWVYVSRRGCSFTVLALNVGAWIFLAPAYQPVWLCRHGEMAKITQWKEDAADNICPLLANILALLNNPPYEYIAA